MTSFLSRILEEKKREVAELYRAEQSNKASKIGTYAGKQERNRFVSAIQNPEKLSVIAEIKRKSPSKGLINQSVDVSSRACAYAKGGAAAISVLTDEVFFHGSLTDLETVRSTVDIPILRKDFIIDTIQIDESFNSGADAILLIVAALAPEKLIELSAYAKRIGLNVLIEVHHVSELEDAIAAQPSVIGINNRDLNTFEVSLDTTIQILRNWSHSYPVISESGFTTLEDVRAASACGIDGILVGESLMRLSSEESIQATISAFSTLADTHKKMGARYV